VAETKEKLESPKKPRSGLSINDTIAANANLSVGARGVDTSGVEAGAGAGAGSTYVTPGAAGSSPAPNIVPGSRGTGSTPRSGTAAEEEASIRLDAKTGLATREEIAARAYQRWCQRGCPEGSPNVDWHAAEEELRPTR
jgi:hypothetical protein